LSNAGHDGAMLTEIAVFLAPAVWLAVTVLVLAVCRAASRADANAAHERTPATG